MSNINSRRNVYTSGGGGSGGHTGNRNYPSSNISSKRPMNNYSSSNVTGRQGSTRGSHRSNDYYDQDVNMNNKGYNTNGYYNNNSNSRFYNNQQNYTNESANTGSYSKPSKSNHNSSQRNAPPSINTRAITPLMNANTSGSQFNQANSKNFSKNSNTSHSGLE